MRFRAWSLVRRARTALLLVLVALTGAACQLRTEVNVTVQADGSGEVEVAVGLDEDGVEQRPDLLDGLEFSDLAETGWVVDGPALDADGFTRIRVRHTFDNPSEVATLVDEVAGDDGPFRDFAVVRDDAFAETRYRFSGVVDFTSGVESLTRDPELAEALGAEPLDLLEARIGGTVDELLRVQVAVRLPGDVDSNAPTKASNGAVWRPSVLEREAVELTATSTIRRSGRLAWLAVAGACGFALLLFVTIRVVAWRRSRTVTSS